MHDWVVFVVDCVVSRPVSQLLLVIGRHVSITGIEDF